MPRIPILLATAFDAETPAGASILGALGRARGRIASAEAFAQSAGYRDRHHLARVLRKAGLPPLKPLVHWTLLLTWVSDWEERRTSLARRAAVFDRDVAWCYRTVRRVTGLTWTEIRTRGTGWVVVEIRRQYGRGGGLRLRVAGRKRARRWIVGSAARRLGGPAVRRFGGSAVRRFGGSAVRRFGGSAARW